MIKTIGERIKEKRKTLKMKQRELAEHTDSYPADISDWELNKTKPSAEKIRKLAMSLKTTTDYLIQGEDKTTKEEGTEMDCIVKLRQIIDSPYLQKNEKAELLGYIQMFYEKEKEEREKDTEKKIQTLHTSKKNNQ